MRVRFESSLQTPTTVHTHTHIYIYTLRVPILSSPSSHTLRRLLARRPTAAVETTVCFVESGLRDVKTFRRG
jgi:hypothetical protein